MLALVLDGTTERTPPEVAATLEALGRLLAERLAALGWRVDSRRLREEHIAWCTGCFGCWQKTPGVCRLDDAGRGIAAAVVQSDLLVLLSPVTFGGYSAELKKAIDRLIGEVTPFFVRVGLETRHEMRYQRYPRLLGLGVQPGEDADSARVFRNLVQRNAQNLHAPLHVSAVVPAGLGGPEQAALLDGLLPRVEVSSVTAFSGYGRMPAGAPSPSPPPASDDPTESAAAAGSGPGANGPISSLLHQAGQRLRRLTAPPRSRVEAVPGRRRFLLLVGSPRLDESASEALGDYLLERLHVAGAETERLRLIPLLHQGARGVDELLAAVDRNDVVILAAPLYVDSLPAGVIRMLEELHAARPARAGRRPGLLALVNCGYPESSHVRWALELCRLFAAQSGFDWLGGIGLGMGGVFGGRPLTDVGRAARPVRDGLEQTAQALAAGQAVPAEAIELMARPPLPRWVYSMAASWGWRLSARRNGVSAQLHQRPFEVPTRG